MANNNVTPDLARFMGRQGPGGSHVGPMNLALWDIGRHKDDQVCIPYA